MRALQQIVYNPSSNIDFKNYVNLYKKNVMQNYILFQLLMILLHQNSFTFQTESFRKNKKLIMTIDGKIRDEKLQYDMNIKDMSI